jgi:hypothetical protein
MARPLKIFVNYALEDGAAAGETRPWLRSQGHEPWIDNRKLIAGRNGPLEMKRTIAASDLTVVCLSHRSLAKTGYVQAALKQKAAALQPQGPLSSSRCDWTT